MKKCWNDFRSMINFLLSDRTRIPLPIYKFVSNFTFYLVFFVCFFFYQEKPGIIKPFLKIYKLK